MGAVSMITRMMVARPAATAAAIPTFCAVLGDHPGGFSTQSPVCGFLTSSRRVAGHCLAVSSRHQYTARWYHRNSSPWSYEGRVPHAWVSRVGSLNWPSQRRTALCSRSVRPVSIHRLKKARARRKCRGPCINPTRILGLLGAPIHSPSCRRGHPPVRPKCV